MSRFQISRLGLVSLVAAAVQTAAVDRVLFLGVAYLALPLFLSVAVGSRMPFTNAVIAGAFVGVAWDLLAVDLFGRYALVCAFGAGFGSLLVSTAQPRRIHRLGGRVAGVAASFVALLLISTVAGETLPQLTWSFMSGLLVSVAVGALISGSVLNRIAVPSRLAWDPAPARSTEWMDRRAGLHSVPSENLEREAA